MDKKGTIFLTSTGFSSKNVYNEFLKIADGMQKEEVAIITTAAENKENNKYSQLALSQFSTMGFSKVDFCDLENEPDRDLSEYKIIYVCGGNTFKLLKYAHNANFKKSVTSLLRKGGIYIGVSAGSLIVGPSIQIAAEVSPDVNDVGLEDMGGLNITNAIIYPHYEEKEENNIRNFETKNNVKVTRLTNNEALIINEDGKTII